MNLPEGLSSSKGARRSYKGLGIALLFVASVILYVSGCSSGSDDGGIGWSMEGSDHVYRFQRIIRIGDDIEYNEHELDHFIIDSAVSESFSASFLVPNFEYSSAFIYGQVAGSSQPDKLHLNGEVVGILPKGNNSAQTTKDFAFDVTDHVVQGENSIEITLETYPHDIETPLDDIEVYDLRLVLRQ